MTPTLEHLKAVAAELPSSERAELAQFLLHSLDEQDETLVRGEWLLLAEQRMNDLRTGTVVGVPAEEVLKDLLRSRK